MTNPDVQHAGFAGRVGSKAPECHRTNPRGRGSLFESCNEFQGIVFRRPRPAVEVARILQEPGPQARPSMKFRGPTRLSCSASPRFR